MDLTEEPGGLQSVGGGLKRVRNHLAHNLATEQQHHSLPAVMTDAGRKKLICRVRVGPFRVGLSWAAEDAGKFLEKVSLIFVCSFSPKVVSDSL